MKFQTNLLLPSKTIGLEDEVASDIEDEENQQHPYRSPGISVEATRKACTNLLSPVIFKGTFKRGNHRNSLNTKKTVIKLIDNEDNEDNEDHSEDSIVFIGTHQEKKKPVRKNLKKMTLVRNKVKLEKKEKTQECPICLLELSLKKKATLPCNHIFCLECILENSKFSNKCPYCRASFNSIQSGKRTIPVEETHLNQEFEDPYNQPCYICGRNDDFDRLLECELCQYAFCHTYCDPRLATDRLPAESWYCNSCEQLLRSRAEDMEQGQMIDD